MRSTTEDHKVRHLRNSRSAFHVLGKKTKHKCIVSTNPQCVRHVKRVGSVVWIQKSTHVIVVNALSGTCYVLLQLKNRTYQNTPITCLNCRTREARIIQKLKVRDAWKSTCKQLLRHSEKCKIYPTRLGERRWPGKNKGVEEDDWKFIEPVWKKRKG